MILDGVKIALCVFVLAILEVAATPQLTPFGGGPDLIIILVVALALWRGMEAAAIAGFAGGLLLDAMTFEHLGMESLVYVGCACVIATYAHRREAALRSAGSSGRRRRHLPLSHSRWLQRPRHWWMSMWLPESRRPCRRREKGACPKMGWVARTPSFQRIRLGSTASTAKTGTLTRTWGTRLGNIYLRCLRHPPRQPAAFQPI